MNPSITEDPILLEILEKHLAGCHPEEGGCLLNLLKCAAVSASELLQVLVSSIRESSLPLHTDYLIARLLDFSADDAMGQVIWQMEEASPRELCHLLHAAQVVYREADARTRMELDEDVSKVLRKHGKSDDVTVRRAVAGLALDVIEHAESDAKEMRDELAGLGAQEAVQVVPKIVQADLAEVLDALRNDADLLVRIAITSSRTLLRDMDLRRSLLSIVAQSPDAVGPDVWVAALHRVMQSGSIDKKLLDLATPHLPSPHVKVATAVAYLLVFAETHIESLVDDFEALSSGPCDSPTCRKHGTHLPS